VIQANRRISILDCLRCAAALAMTAMVQNSSLRAQQRSASNPVLIFLSRIFNTPSFSLGLGELRPRLVLRLRSQAALRRFLRFGRNDTLVTFELTL